MSKNNKSVGNFPPLRFKGFEGKWEEKKFEEIFIFSVGKNIKQSEASPEFEIPCVRYGELYHMYGEVIDEVVNRTNLDRTELLFSKGDEILLPSAGEDPLDIGSASALTIRDVAIGRTINVLRPKANLLFSHIFVAYYINQHLRKKISSLAKGVSISNVYNSDLKKLELLLPSLTEQQQIASFLSLIDRRIQTQNKIIEHLETLMSGLRQKFFSQQIRFKDDNGNDFPDWEEKRLGDVVNVIKGKQLNKDALTEEGTYPCQNGGIEPSGFTEEYNTNKNTITISEGGNSCGYVNYITTKFWCGGHCYALHNVSKFMSDIFLFQYLKFSQDDIMKLRVGSGLPNIQKGDIVGYKILTPSLPEQTKIANFLSSLDKKIEAEKQILAQYQSQKKYFLQNLFI